MSFASESKNILHLKTCRVCMDTDNTNIISLSEQNGWFELFEYCFGLELTSEDQPRVICQHCADKIKCYAKFKQKCYESNKFWKNLKIQNDYVLNPASNRVDDLVQEENREYYSDDNTNIHTDIEEDCNNIIKNEDQRDFNNVIFLNNNDNDVKIEIVENQVLLDVFEPKDMLADVKPVFCDINAKAKCTSNTKTKLVAVFTCKRCQRNYASRLWYQKHLKLCYSKKKNKSTINRNSSYNPGSQINSKSTSKVSTYNENDRNRDKIEENVNFCVVCKCSSKSTEDFNIHLDEHWTNNDLQCLMCDFAGKDEAAIAAHRYSHYILKASNYRCHKCLHKSKSQLSLQFHYRKVHLNKSGGLCSQPLCHTIFNSWKMWKKHEKVHIHPGYICDICGQKYKYRHNIVEHLMIHTNPTLHVCDVCGKTFGRLRNLNVHIANVHSKPDQIKCTHCNKVFKTKNYLNKHLRLEAMEKKWKCEFCPMEYPVLSALKSHMDVHSNEKPHCCNICGARYKRSGPLLIHMRNHRGERPFKCLVCTKAFTTNNQLKSHSRTHTGILPYKCSYCEKSFRCKKRMLKHCASHNKE